ncbi:MAG: cyclic 2,3-diphosphoglycerate synthase [Firmicutes bacterium]|jgi:predicted GTPase|nr:cyclic 2,3-diphosphoglycerate synthase [Bacillota bacterium]MDD4337096.1 cyclic 2,3-diphosphoglycerate synthase [Bacillota bacterium]MDD4791483.1 cyclic 2,3-diphosphoglycerate synthase [Bacillota bacterium]
MGKTRVIIMGAAGRDFHNFNVYFRDNERYDVVAFTATQIPDIAGRVYPAVLAGKLYPNGIPIYPEDELEELIRKHGVDQAIFAYSDLSHVDIMHKASAVMAAGADFRLMGPKTTMLESKVPIVAIVAVRTGVGKSQTTRYVSQALIDAGLKVVAIRHPMPYGDLAKQAVQRFATYEDLDIHKCTIEEREEYEPHIDKGIIVYAGVDYGKILEEAEKEADVILWDGGNNDFSFYKPDLTITLVDPHRAGHEVLYHPGETNVRLADVVIINKVDTAKPDDIETVRKNVKRVNPRAQIVDAASPVTVEDPEKIRGKRVLVVEDGPTLTHGGMGFGAGVVAARQFGAKELVEPRPFAVGSLVDTLETFCHREPLLPAMGYSEKQIRELETTIDKSDAEVVVIGTPIDLRRVLEINKPAVRVRYELKQESGPDLVDIVRAKFVKK